MNPTTTSKWKKIFCFAERTRAFRSLVLCVAVLTSLSACGKLDRTIAHYRGYAEVCVHGVDYLQFSSGASVEYDREGHVVTCPTKTENNNGRE